MNSGRSVIALPAAVLERIHFLGDDVGGLADRPGEHRGMLDGRHLDALEAVQAAHLVERRDHRGEAVGVFSEQALGAPDGLNWRHFSALKHKIRAKRNQRVVAPCCRSCWNSRRIVAGEGTNSFLKLIIIVRPIGSSRSG